MSVALFDVGAPVSAAAGWRHPDNLGRLAAAGIVGAEYVARRDAAVAAAQRNGASLWFAGAPSDLAGFVFQDSVGATPATGTDPIGLLLDRSYGAANLGPELVVNGDGTNTAGWNASVATIQSVDGRFVVSNTTTSPGFVTRSFATVVGKSYRMSGVFGPTAGPAGFKGLRKADNTGATTNVVNIATAAAGTNPAVVSAGQIFTATASTTFAVMQVNGDPTAALNTATFGSISCVEVLGIPATQPTAANKPTLELQPNGYYGMRFDGVNDVLTAVLPLYSAGSATIICSGVFGSGNIVQSIGEANTASNLQEYSPNYRATNNLLTVFVRNNANTTIVNASSTAPAISGAAVFSCIDTGSSITNFANGVAGNAIPYTRSGVLTLNAIGLGATPRSTIGGASNSLYCLFCAAPSVMPDADRIAVERFGALLSGAPYP